MGDTADTPCLRGVFFFFYCWKNNDTKFLTILINISLAVEFKDYVERCFENSPVQTPSRLIWME